MSNEYKDWLWENEQTLNRIKEKLNKGEEVAVVYKDELYEVESGAHSESCDVCHEKFWIPNPDGECLAPDAFLLLHATGELKGGGAHVLCKTCLATETIS